MEDKQPEKETFEVWMEKERKDIMTLIVAFPERYLFTEPIFIKTKELSGFVDVAFFTCGKCNKPISHHQMIFSGLCGSCDIGNRNPFWIVTPPESVRRRSKEFSDMEKLRRENEKLKEVDKK